MRIDRPNYQFAIPQCFQHGPGQQWPLLFGRTSSTSHSHICKIASLRLCAESFLGSRIQTFNVVHNVEANPRTIKGAPCNEAMPAMRRILFDDFVQTVLFGESLKAAYQPPRVFPLLSISMRLANNTTPHNNSRGRFSV